MHFIEHRLLKDECSAGEDTWYWIYARRAQWKTVFALRRHNQRAAVSSAFTRWSTRAYRSRYRRSLAEHNARKRQRLA